MVNISPKLFQKAIQTGLKTALFTTSTAALMLSSSGALGVAAGVISTNNAAFSDLAAANTWHEITAAGADNGNPAGGPQDNEAFTYGGNHTITADEAGRIIQAINVAGTNPGALNITQNTSVGSIVTGGNLLPVTIGNGKILTLTGTDAVAANHGFAAAADTYTGLGAVTLSDNAELIIESGTPALITLAGAIDGDDDGHGGLIVNTQTNFTGAIGGTKALLGVTFNNGNAGGGSSAGAISATTVTIGEDAGNNASIVKTGAITGDVNFANAGTLTVDGGITGAVTTDGNAATGGTLIVAGGNITNVGVLNNALTAVTFNNGDNGGAGFTAGDIFATTVTIGEDAGNNASKVQVGAITGNVAFANAGTLTATGAITGNVVVSAGGTLAANNTITGAVTFGAAGGTLAAGGTITGNVTVSDAGIITGAQDVVGDVIIANGAGAVTIKDVTGAEIEVNNGGPLTLKSANNGLKFTGTAVAATTVNVSAGNGNIGNIDNDVGGDIGTVNFLGASTVGTIGATQILHEVNFNGAAGTTVTIGGAARATTFNVGAGGVGAQAINGAINFAQAGQLSAAGAVTGTALFTADGTLTLDAGITGAVTSVGNNGTLIVNAGDVLAAIGTNGGANILKQVTFNGASNVTSIDATNVTINNGAADVTAANAITAAVNFAADGALTANNGITGAVTAVNGKGTLTAAAVGVTGAVGTNAASLKVLNAKVDNGAADLVFTSDIYAQTVNFDDVAGGGAVGTIQAGGNLIATAVNFGGNADGGVLEFNGGGAGPYGFKGAIANGANATLNINTASLTAYDPTIGTVAQINIGAGNLFSIDVSAGDVTILNNQVINFVAADSRLDFSNTTGAATKNVLLANNLVAFGGDGGDLFFDGGTNGLNVGSNVAGTPRNIGDAGGDKFDTLSILSKVTITKDINLAGIQALVLRDDADFTDNGNSSVNIAAIEINDAIYTIDANDANVNVPAANIGFAHADATLVLQNSSNANDRTITLGANINPNNPDEGIVILNSVNAGKKLTIAGGVTLGGPNRLQAIVFQGAGDFDTTGIIFNTTDIGLNTAGAIKLGATPANVTLLNDAVQLTQTGNIGGFLDFKGKNATVTLNDGVNITGAVQNTGGNNNGTLIALGASKLGSVNGIAMLKVGAGAVSIGGAGGEIKIGEIQGNGTALLTLPANFKLTGAINATGGQALKLNFTNGGSVSGIVGKVGNEVGDITTAGTTSFASSVNAKGTATFGGTTSFADTFTNTGAVTLAKDSINNFAKDVTATSFVANGAAMNFGNSLAFNSDITGSGTTLTLGANQVAYTGTGSFTDTLTLNTTFDGAAKSGGNILIKSGSTLDLSGASTLALVVTATNFDINNISPDTKYTVISAETAGGLKPTPAGNVKITVNNDNRFVKFTFDASTLTLFAEDVAKEVIEKEFTGVTQTSLELMENAPNGSDARQALANFGDMTNSQIVDAVGHLIQDVVKPSEVVAACSQAISGNILGNLVSINTRISTAQAAAVAAGDEDMDAKFGGWINPFVGNATQKKIQNISGYKSDTTGGTLGFDALINDDAVLGLAYTRAETDVKLKDAKSGDKNKVRSNIFSLYGLYNLPQSNFFVEGVASYGDSKVTSKSRRVISTGLETIGYQTASGKYKSENYTGQLMAGYTYALPETVSAMPLVVTPMAGIRYSDIKDKGYKETGTTYQNLLVKGKNYNTFDGLLGGKVSSNINVGEVVLTPALYAMVDYAFKNKAPAIDARLQGMAAPFPTNSFKPKKTSFDVGVGVTAKHKMMEYGINYDTNIGSKYFAQQGSVKVRVNF